MPVELRELRVSDEARGDAEELRRRLADDGYLFFRRLQDADKLRALRREMLTVMQACGWLVAGSDPIDGIADIDRRCAEGDVDYREVYHQVYRLESFHDSAHWPEVTGMLEHIIGRPVMPHPQKIARLWFPQYTEHTTPIHQDFVHFQGCFETYTCWAPVGDCPIELGGLAVLPGSHKVGRVLDHHFSLGAGSLQVDVADFEPIWYTTDYEIGDTLIFPALTIHQALPNVTEDRLRVSLDNRYLAIGDTIAAHMLNPHLSMNGELTWPEVYRDWQSDTLQYYWRQYDNPVVPLDTRYADKGWAEALELARGGDPRALHQLRRTVTRDPASPQAQAAAEILAALP